MERTAQKDLIGTEAKPLCYLCGSPGKILYRECKDRLFGTPGNWTLKQCPSSECGLVWLDPMPIREEISKAYKNYYTHHEAGAGAPKKSKSTFKQFMQAFRLTQANGYYALKYRVKNQTSLLGKLAGLLIYLQPAVKAKYDFKAMYLQTRPGARLLEIGCGSGDQLAFLQGLGWQVEGLDVDPVAAGVASARGLKVHVGSLEEQCFPARQFDAIVSSHVIEHVHDPVGLLRECSRILSPGGRLVIITPNTTSWFHKWFGANWLALDSPRHLHLFNSISLRRAAEHSGLSVRVITSTVREADGVYRASRDIRDTGHHVWGCRHSWAVRRWSRVLQLLEWLLLQLGVDRGEELMAICEPNRKA